MIEQLGGKKSAYKHAVIMHISTVSSTTPLPGKNTGFDPNNCPTMGPLIIQEFSGNSPTARIIFFSKYRGSGFEYLLCPI